MPLLRDSSYAELSGFDVGRTNPNTAYGRDHAPAIPRDGERIPILSSVIETVRAINPAFRLMIEIKTAEGDSALSAPAETVV